MDTEVTPQMIFEDFKSRYPLISKKAIDYRPFGIRSIKIWFSDGSVMTYGYDEKIGHLLRS